MEKKEMIEIKEKTNAVIIKEFKPDGALIEYNSSGEAKGENYKANHMETTDVKMKMDGTNEWESRAMEMTKEGDVVMVMGKGTGQGSNFKGEVTYMTNSPRLSWLNNTKAHVEGVSDMKSNTATMKVWPEKKIEATVAQELVSEPEVVMTPMM
jgi:hypothetical protein